MIDKKKWLALFAVLATVFLLSACGSKEQDGATNENSETPNEAEENKTAGEAVRASEALEDRRIWYMTSDTLKRTSQISKFFVFENGTLTTYRNFTEWTGKTERPTLEYLSEMTNDEIIDLAKDISTSVSSGNYTLDIILDDFGQGTEQIDLLWHDAMNEFTFKAGTDIDGEFLDEDLIKERELEEGEREITLGPLMVREKIFDTTFSGYKLYNKDKSLLTQVEESSPDFELDTPESTHELITIEGE